MSTVRLGHNVFKNCRAIFAHRDQTVLALKTSPVLVTLDIPSTPSHPERRFRIIDGEVDNEPTRLVVKKSEGFCAVFFDNWLVVVAVALDEDEVHLRLDLRPFAVSIFDDVRGLHVGPNIVAGNLIEDVEVAIVLG